MVLAAFVNLGRIFRWKSVSWLVIEASGGVFWCVYYQDGVLAPQNIDLKNIIFLN